MWRRTSRSRGRELVELGVHLRGRQRRRAGERVEHEAGEPRGEHRVALGDPAHRVGELIAGDRLGHVAARAGADDRDHVLGGVGHRQRQEALRGARAGRPGGSPRPRRRPASARRAARRRARARARSAPRPRPWRRRRAPSTSPSSSARTPARNRWWSSTITTLGALIARSPAPPRCPRRATSARPRGRRGGACARRSTRRTPRRSSGTARGSKPGPRSRTNTSVRSSPTSA